MRLEHLRREFEPGQGLADLRDLVDKSLLAHLCRCTGWQTIHEAVDLVVRRGDQDRVDQDREDPSPVSTELTSKITASRDFSAASRRADMEGHSHQTVHPRISLGDGGFAEDIAPRDALVAVMKTTSSSGSIEWVIGEDVASARRAAGSVQGRKSTVPVSWPIEIDMSHDSASDFVRTLSTTWVEPAYLEPDAVWCTPGGEPVGPLVNGGAFGGKSDLRFVAELRDAARRLADEHGRAVRVVLSREDVVRRGPKRPPVALGARADGSGTMWVARTPGLLEMVERLSKSHASEMINGWDIIEVDVPGPPTSMHLRAAVWAEIAVARSSVGMSHGRVSPDHVSPDHFFTDHVVAPNGAEAWARVEMVEGRRDDQDSGAQEPGSRERIVVRVRCGDPLDHTVLRSYCIGAAHMALGWVRNEGIAVAPNPNGDVVPVDLTIRSFGVLRAIDTPEIVVEIDEPGGDGRDGRNSPDFSAVNGSDAVFAAVAAAVWRHDGFPAAWPSRR